MALGGQGVGRGETALLAMVHGLLGTVGAAPVAVDDEVGAHLQQPAAPDGQGSGIDGVGQLRFALRSVQGGAAELAIGKIALVATVGDQLNARRHP